MIMTIVAQWLQNSLRAIKIEQILSRINLLETSGEDTTNAAEHFEPSACQD